VPETGDDYLLRVKNLKVRYGNFEALRDVSFTIPAGEIVSLLGPNGAGKSTTVRAISGMKSLSSGEIWFQGIRIDNKSANEIVKMGISHILEGRGLFPQMTVLENLQMGAYSLEDAKKEEIERDIEKIYEHFPVLKEKRKDRAETLSGGQGQQLAIARGLMSKPKLLLMDEPLQGLSPVLVEEIVSIITRLKESGVTILVIEQNVSIAFNISKWVYFLFDGELVLQGRPQELSETEYVQKFYLGV
jgi:branched-chain amino acid transport system ATP-binding protein